MNNQDRVAKVIDRHGFDPCREPECIAQDLADAGLLAPDLPDPDLDHRDPAHRAEFEAWWEGPVPDVWNKGLPDVFTVQVFPDKPEVGLYLDLEPFEPFSPQEARKLAYALLAAAQHQEGSSE